jgi:hypothetical protein
MSEEVWSAFLRSPTPAQVSTSKDDWRVIADVLLKGKTMNNAKLGGMRRVLGRALLVSAMAIATTVVQEDRKVAAATTPSPKVTSLTGTLEVGQTITVEMNGLAEWSAEHDPRKLVLYLNGRALKGTYPEQVSISENKLLFHLTPTPDSNQVWADLFHEPVLRRPVTLSVGLEDQSPFATLLDYDHRVSLIIIPKIFGILSLAVILSAIILFGYLIRTTDIIRDPGPRPKTGEYKRYNLARAQTAFWFFLVIVAYICLWLITGDFNTLTPSVLVLIGISGATTLGAGLVKRTNELKGVIETTSSGFWADILSDANGYGFHRFQIIAWTILLGIIFVWSVYHYVAMPNFSGGVLALMGISAGTYLGFESVQEDVFKRIAAAGR